MKLNGLIVLALIMWAVFQSVCFAEEAENYMAENIIDNAVSAEKKVPYAVEGGNIYYDIHSGMIKDCDESVTSAVIPSSINGIEIKGINLWAFSGCVNLKSVKIPESVKIIDSWAFLSCESLTSIDIPYSVDNISSSAFEGCLNLTSINVSDNNMVYSSIDGVLFNKDKTQILKYPQGLKDKSYTIPLGVTGIRSCQDSTKYFL